MDNYIWTWNESQGVKVQIGDQGDHYTIMESVPDNLYDLTIRGYAKIDFKKKSIRLSLSPCTPLSNHFYPEKVVQYFTKHYKGFPISKVV